MFSADGERILREGEGGMESGRGRDGEREREGWSRMK